MSLSSEIFSLREAIIKAKRKAVQQEQESSSSQQQQQQQEQQQQQVHKQQQEQQSADQQQQQQNQNSQQMKFDQEKEDKDVVNSSNNQNLHVSNNDNNNTNMTNINKKEIAKQIARVNINAKSITKDINYNNNYNVNNSSNNNNYNINNYNNNNNNNNNNIRSALNFHSQQNQPSIQHSHTSLQQQDLHRNQQIRQLAYNAYSSRKVKLSHQKSISFHMKDSIEERLKLSMQKSPLTYSRTIQQVGESRVSNFTIMNSQQSVTNRVHQRLTSLRNLINNHNDNDKLKDMQYRGQIFRHKQTDRDRQYHKLNGKQAKRSERQLSQKQQLTNRRQVQVSIKRQAQIYPLNRQCEQIYPLNRQQEKKDKSILKIRQYNRKLLPQVQFHSQSQQQQQQQQYQNINIDGQQNSSRRYFRYKIDSQMLQMPSLFQQINKQQLINNNNKKRNNNKNKNNNMKNNNTNKDTNNSYIPSVRQLINEWKQIKSLNTNRNTYHELLLYSQ